MLNSLVAYSKYSQQSSFEYLGLHLPNHGRNDKCSGRSVSIFWCSK